jgi:hypothetical protein
LILVEGHSARDTTASRVVLANGADSWKKKEEKKRHNINQGGEHCVEKISENSIERLKNL